MNGHTVLGLLPPVKVALILTNSVMPAGIFKADLLRRLWPLGSFGIIL